MWRFLKFLPLLVLKLAGIWWLIGYYYAWFSTKKAHKKLLERKHLNDIPIQNIELQTTDRVALSAWYVPAKSDKAVIILSGRGENRQHSVDRAEYYLNKGYSVFLPDLRGTGKSGGPNTSFGWHERKDLIACHQFLKEKNYTHIAAHGYSLGAATISYSLKKIPNFHFIVLESCYSSLCKTVRNQMDAHSLPEALAYPMKYFTEKITGLKIKILVPEEFIKHAKVPTLIMAGDKENMVTKQDTLALYQNCKEAPISTLHLFSGARHENFLASHPKEYVHLMNNFLQDVENHYYYAQPYTQQVWSVWDNIKAKFTQLGLRLG